MSVIKNTDPLLIELSELKDFFDRIKFADKHLKKIGEGSSRIVYKIKDLVLKLAIDKKGIAQNLEEARPLMQRECTNAIVLADTDGKWIIVNKAEKITKKKFEELIGINFDDFSDALFYKFNNEDSFEKPEDYDDIVKNDLFECLVKWIIDCDPQLGDVAGNIDNWGIINGKPVVIDYGLSRDIYTEFYEE